MRRQRPVPSRPAALLSACVLALSVACGDAPPSASPPRLVLLFAPCSVGKAHLAPYDESVFFTPHLRAFAERSVVFRRHQTEAGQSGPAYASLFSGGQADHHGVYRNPERLPDDVYVAAETFAEAGYETFYWIGHPAATSELNFHQGIGVGNAFLRYLRASDPRFVAILERPATDPGYRAFVITNPLLAHLAYRMEHWDAFHARHPRAAEGLDLEELTRLATLYRENYHLLAWNFPLAAERLELSGERLERFVRAVDLLYASNVSFLDQEFGGLVDAIDAHGLADHSLIAFTADHGEVMYRENAPFQWSHSLQLAPEALGVPLILRSPGLAPGAYEGVTRSIDVFPTLAGLAGVPIAAEHGVQGVDLSAALRGGAPAPRLVAPSHTAVLAPAVFRQMYQPRWRNVWGVARGFFPRVDPKLIWVSMRDGDMVYKREEIEADRWEFRVFDLASDPGETTNLYDPENPRHVEMAAALMDYKARLVEGYRGSAEGETRQLRQEQEAELLRGLGYIRRFAALPG